jgi:hypothetical protein
MFFISEWERRATRRLHEHLSGSRVGLRWERIFRSHEAEIDALAAVYPEVRQHLGNALRGLDQVTRDGTVDDATVEATARVLDDLDRLGGLELRRIVEALRDELALARGRTLEQLLSG